MKKFFIWILCSLLVLVVVYKILASISLHPIDKSFQLGALNSPKSAPETYSLGYQPRLIYSEAREPCAAQYPEKKALFGRADDVIPD